MEKRQFLRLLCGGGALVLTGALSACVEPYPVRRRPVRYDPDYYYYPDVNVYFGIATGYYYYFDNTYWIRSRTLPRRIVLVPRYRRPIYVGHPEPHRFNREHRRRYRLAGPTRPHDRPPAVRRDRRPPPGARRLPREEIRRRRDENRRERKRNEHEWRRRRDGRRR